MRTMLILGTFLLGFATNGVAGQRDPVLASLPSEIEYALANVEFTLLHEFAHVFIAELNIPVLGYEEDVADQFATMVFLALQDDGSDGSHRKIDSVARELSIEAVADPFAFRDSHPPAIKRFYDLLCLAYGRDPDRFHDYVQNRWLPPERAVYCGDEYEQASDAVLWIYSQYGRPVWPPLLHMRYDPASLGLRMDTSASLPGHGEGGRISISYGASPPPNSAGVLRELESSGILRKLARQVEGTFRLPRDLQISFKACSADAFWNRRSGEIVICYSLIESYLDNSRKMGGMRKILNGQPEAFTLLFSKEISDVLSGLAARRGVSINEVVTEALKNYLEISPESEDLQERSTETRP